MQANIPVQDPMAPVKNEEIFLPYESHTKLLTWLKRLSVLAIPLALYQISAGFFFTSQHPSSLNSSLSFAGIFSLAFLSFVLYWTFITTRKEEKVHNIYPQTKDHLSNFALLITSFIKLAQVPVLLTNLYFQQEYIYDLIGADKSITSPWEVTQQPSSGFMNGIMKAYAITELIFFAYSLFAAISLMKYSLKPKKLCSIFIFAFNAIMLGTSLSLAFTAYRAWTPQNYPRFSSLFPESTLASLLGLGVIGSLSSLPIWLINHKKWRVGFFAGFILTLLTSVCLFGLSNSAYSDAQNIYQTYKDTENSREWSLNMGLVSQKEIEAAGCPSKYVSPSYCGNDSIISAWESASTNGIRPYCLNKQCAGILGQLYTEQFLHISNWSLMTAISSLLLSIGMLYSSKTRGRSDSTKQRNKGRHNKWLFTLGVVGLCVTLVYGFTPNYSIEEFKDSQNYADQANSGEDDYLNWISAANNVMNKAGLIQNNGDVEYLITQMLTTRSDRFLIMKQDVQNNKLILEKRGGKDQTYQQFLDALSPVEAQIALVQVPIDNKQMLIEVIWTPEDGSVERNNEILKQYAQDNRGSFYNENLKMMVVTASKIEDLSLNQLYKELPSLGQLREAYKRVSDEIIVGTDKLIDYLTRRVQSDLTLEAQSAEEIVFMIRDRKSKFLAFELKEDSETVAVSQRGNWESNFNDFVKNMNPEKPQIALTFLHLDGTVRLVEILYMPESATPLEKQLFTEYYANKELNEAKEIGLETYVARKTEELELQMILKFLYPMDDETVSEENNVVDFTNKSSAAVDQDEEYLIGDDVKTEFERFLNQEEGQKNYKYAVFKWNNEKEMGIEKIGALWKNYYQFLYDLPTSTAISPRLAFYNVEIEAESYPIMILWLPECHSGDNLLKQKFKSCVEEFGGKTSGYIMTGEPRKGIEEIFGHLAISNKIKSREGGQGRGLIDENAPNMVYMKSPSMVPRGVTFLKTLEDWDDQLSLQEGSPMNIDMPGTPRADASITGSSSRVLEVDSRRLESLPLDFLKAPGAWAPPASYVVYLREVEESYLRELRVPDLDSMKAKGALAPNDLDVLRAKSALAAPNEIELLKAKSALAPNDVELLKAKSALAPNDIEFLKAKSALAAPNDIEFLKAKSALAPNDIELLKAKSALAPNDIELLKAKSALAAPNDIELLKAKSALAAPNEIELLKAKSALAPNDIEFLKAKSALAPNDIEFLKAKSALSPNDIELLKAKSALAPNEIEFLKAKSALAPNDIELLKAKSALAPNDIELLKAKSALSPNEIELLKAKSALSPNDIGLLKAKSALAPNDIEFLKAKTAIRPPVAVLKTPGSLRPPSEYLKAAQPLKPPLSLSSSNDLLVLFGASSSPPNYMLKSTSLFDALPSSSDLTYLRQSNNDQEISQQRSLGETAFGYSPLTFFRTFQLTELFDFFDDFSLNQTFNNNIRVAEGVNVTIQDMIQTHKYSYIILGLDASSTNLTIIEKGKAANSYEAFLTKFNKDRSQIAIIDLSVENTSKFVLILYVPDTASQSERDAFNNYIIPQASLFTKNQGVPVLIAHTSRDVKLANILKYAFSLPQDKSTNATQPTLLKRRGIQGSQQRISPIVFHLKTQYIAGDVETVLNEVIVGRKYKYVLLDWNTTTQLLQVTKKASINTNYDQFLKEFQPGKSRIALLDFGYEGKDIPVLISWGSELIYSQPWQAQAYQLILTEATNLNIPYYEPRELVSLQLPNLVDYLFTFWPLQINSYTKYTSNQLLSVLQSSPDSATLESILQPVYSNNVSTKGESVLTEMLLRRKYKYLLFKEVEEAGENKLLFVKTAPQTSTTKDFLNDTKGNGNQLALLYLEFAGQDRIVALVMTDPGTLEKNYINYARIASAAEVYDIPTAYVSSPEALDIEQLTQFTFADDILRILETLKVDPGVQDHWAAAQNGTIKGYVTITLQDGNSHIKIEKSNLGDQVTYADFQKELTPTKPFWAILNTADMNEKIGSSKPRLISWIPAGSDLPSKILYKNAENILLTSLPGSKVYSNPDLIPK